MKTYEIQFIGRKKGAIGKFYEIRTQVFAPDVEAATLALYERFEHIQQPEFKEIQSPFDADGLLRRVMNEASVHAEIERHVRAIYHAVDRLADKAAKENADWHDDQDSADHGLYHSHAELQYAASMRTLAAAEAALYFLRETPAGMEVFNQLLLQAESGVDFVAIRAANAHLRPKTPQDAPQASGAGSVPIGKGTQNAPAGQPDAKAGHSCNSQDSLKGGVKP